MSLLSEGPRRRLKQIVREEMEGAHVVSATISVDESGQITIEELVLRQGAFGQTFAIGMRPEDPERGVVLDRHVGPGGWSRNGQQLWCEVTAGDYLDEEGDGLDD